MGWFGSDDDKEQKDSGGSLWGSILKGAGIGAAGGLAFAGVGAIPGAIVGGLGGLAHGLIGGDDDKGKKDAAQEANGHYSDLGLGEKLPSAPNPYSAGESRTDRAQRAYNAAMEDYYKKNEEWHNRFRNRTGDKDHPGSPPAKPSVKDFGL